MPRKRKHDGPALSGTGYRYGGEAAFQSWLPSRAIKPGRTDSESAENLAAFKNYPGRAKSIGLALPRTQGASPNRAAALQRIQNLEQEDYQSIALKKAGEDSLVMYFSGNKYLFVMEVEGTRYISKIHQGRERAMSANSRRIYQWRRQERRSLPLLPSLNREFKDRD